MLINFRRRYTEAEWERLSGFAKDNGYPNLCEMIRRRAVKALSNGEECEPCNGVKAVKFDKNLELQFREDTGVRIACMANKQGISFSELIARIVTDPILGK